MKPSPAASSPPLPRGEGLIVPSPLGKVSTKLTDEVIIYMFYFMEVVSDNGKEERNL